MQHKKPFLKIPHSEHDSEQTQNDYAEANFHNPDYIATEDEFTFDYRKDTEKMEKM